MNGSSSTSRGAERLNNAYNSGQISESAYNAAMDKLNNSTASATSGTPSSSTGASSTSSHENSAYWSAQNSTTSSTTSTNYSTSSNGYVPTTGIQQVDNEAIRRAEADEEYKQIQDDYADLKQGEKKVSSTLDKFVVSGSSIGKSDSEGVSRGKVQLPTDTSEYTDAINEVTNDVDKTEKLMQKVADFDAKYGDLNINKDELGGIHKELGKKVNESNDVINGLIGTRSKIDEINQRQANLFGGSRKVTPHLQVSGTQKVSQSKVMAEYTIGNTGKETPEVVTNESNIARILSDPNQKGTTDAEKIVNAYNEGKIKTREEYKAAMANINTNTGKYEGPLQEQIQTKPQTDMVDTTQNPAVDTKANAGITTNETTPSTTSEVESTTPVTSPTTIERILADNNIKGATDAEKITNAYNKGLIPEREDYKAAMANINTNTGKYEGPLQKQIQTQPQTDMVDTTQNPAVDTKANVGRTANETTTSTTSEVESTTPVTSPTTIEKILADNNIKGATDAEKLTNAYNKGLIPEREDYKAAMANIDPNTGKYISPIKSIDYTDIDKEIEKAVDLELQNGTNSTDKGATKKVNMEHPEDELEEKLKGLYDLDTREGRACYVYDILTQVYDYSKDGALAAMAHMLGTNGTFDPTRYQGDNPDMPGYGLCQWEWVNKWGQGCGSADEMKDWCNANGWRYDTIEGQLAWLNHYIPIKEAEYYHDTGDTINLQEELQKGTLDFGTLVKHFGDVHQGMQNSEVKNPTRAYGAERQLFPIIARKNDYLLENKGKYNDLPEIHTSSL